MIFLYCDSFSDMISIHLVCLYLLRVEIFPSRKKRSSYHSESPGNWKTCVDAITAIPTCPRDDWNWGYLWDEQEIQYNGNSQESMNKTLANS